MIAETIPAIADLSREEQLLLAVELWNRHTALPEDPESENVIARFLEERHREYLENPDNVISWEDLKRKYGRD